MNFVTLKNTDWTT